MLEVCKGYPHHIWFAMGHLAEAEDETVQFHPDIAEQIRSHRIQLQSDNEYKIDFDGLVKMLVDYEAQLTNEQLREIYGDQAPQIQTPQR
jgi:hypothetical protein